MKVYCVRHSANIAIDDADETPDVQRYWANSVEDLDRAKRSLVREKRIVLGVIEYDVPLTPEGLIHFIAQFECDLDNQGIPR